jgi:hypothetical protein
MVAGFIIKLRRCTAASVPTRRKRRRNRKERDRVEEEWKQKNKERLKIDGTELI